MASEIAPSSAADRMRTEDYPMSDPLPEGYHVVEDPEEVVILLCIHNLDGKAGRRIWRRLAVPADFSLLELHVALQNAFSWENSHLHSFQQTLTPTLLPDAIPKFPGFGPTDISSHSLLDLDTLPPGQTRTFQTVVGIHDSGFDLLTPVLGGAGGGEEEGDLEGKEGKEGEEGEEGKEGKEGRMGGVPVVYVQHSHPHAEGMGGGKEQEFASPPEQVLEERAYRVRDVLSSPTPALLYEYNFGISHQLTLLYEGLFQATEGVNYPACLGGAGASRAEDGDDLDGDGNLMEGYDFEDFAVLEVTHSFDQTYGDSWPAGPGAEDNTRTHRCYMCRFNRECARRSKCSGSCCGYCLKAETAQSGGMSLAESDTLYSAAAAKIFESRNEWLEGKCGWVEHNGHPCVMCST